ncbi:hypothetical protein VRRI112168_10830 [Vreelandella rituensis]|uniref:Uncharacterized protein n=1 Tax=Vreelandella rituensis TaxID=2282306 RepID=A0A368TZW4_9GAMM|nr:hypothetical protein [Halomonas rituensis]RCV90308.1 hypothetical protein DU506_11880 [Halomonas rituensis]
MFGIDSNASAWKSWIEQRQKAREAHSAVRVSEAENRHKTAQARLYHLLRELSPAGSWVSQPPTDDEVSREMNKLNARVEHYQKLGAGGKTGLAAHRHELDKLESAGTEEKDAAAALVDAQKREAVTRDALEKIESSMPAATPKALSALASEIASRQKQIQKIDAAIDGMQDESGHASLIEVEAIDAAAAVDAMEADALLGEVSKADMSTASTRLAKARKAAETARQQADKQASARRGLEFRRDAFEAEVAELDEIRTAAAFELGRVELAQAEAALLDALSGDRLQPLMDAVNRARSELNANAPEGTAYSTARLNIELPFLYEITMKLGHLEF